MKRLLILRGFYFRDAVSAAIGCSLAASGRNPPKRLLPINWFYSPYPAP
jgi:hypothetical protein